MDRIDSILNYLTLKISNEIKNKINNYPNLKKTIQEIRIRVSKPIILKERQNDFIIEHIVTNEEILQIMERLCENSIYAYKNQLCEGFLTLKGGHRVGITGSCVIENGKIQNIKYISSINIRITREVLNCSNCILDEILDLKNETIYNTLIISPPGHGKTTMLRDIVRQISNGIESKKLKGKTVGLIDERGELAACYKGIPQNDVGLRTDIISNIPKSKAIEILIRSMAPEIIACDEIGNKEDYEAIHKMFISGVKGIFTMHGKDINDIKENEQISKLLNNKQIEKIIVL